MSLKKSVTDQIDSFRKRIFVLEDNCSNAFNELAIEIFQFQAENNKIYGDFITAIRAKLPEAIEEIPFLPISFFKSHDVLIEGRFNPIHKFQSSGTTSSERSKHWVPDLSLYEESFIKTYRNQMGNPEDQVILALLPNYIEQGDSSLVYMVQKLISLSGNSLSGFVLDNSSVLLDAYKKALQNGKKIIVFGVSYALLDLAESKVDLSMATIIETGGMKGRRKELTKTELHEELMQGLNVSFISSEYGMSELLSQGYSHQDGYFSLPPWMKILIRDVNDPFSYLGNGKTGGVNVIDLANLYSCCFISTQDLGRLEYDGFKIVGRFDNADLRGCNLLVQ